VQLRPDQEPYRLAEERTADQDHDGSQEDGQLVAVLDRVEDVGEDPRREEQAGGETEPRRGAGDEAEPEPADRRRRGEQEDQQVESVQRFTRRVGRGGGRR
jgi:hypothetical protein